MAKRVFLIVLDSMGIGGAPDAALFGDEGSDTLGAIRTRAEFDCPNLKKLGLFNIEGVGGGVSEPLACFARMTEASKGKDTTIGHWEIAGIRSDSPLPTYPNGFPREVLDEFEKQTGRGVLCNLPYSGTDVIRDFGEEHLKTGKLIVYTSADSVFQIAAHEDLVPVAELYRYCEIARKILTGKHGVGRVIARPFAGEYPFVRTPRRHDYSLLPPAETMLDRLQASGLDTISVGKIADIFAGRGISEGTRTLNNRDGMEKTIALAKRDFHGLCFVNLVDFDMVYGHRNDVKGYAAAMTEFDRELGELLPLLRPDDLLLITADHGCDPSTPSTDHSRECTPMLLYGQEIRAGVDLGVRDSFADISATVLEALGVSQSNTYGNSFYRDVQKKTVDDRELMLLAEDARTRSYSPYSGFCVGAALLTRSGKIYTGCNVENAGYTPTVCAERTAVFKAVTEGEREFSAIAIVGGKRGKPSPLCAPCGVCRQVLAEFVDPDFRILLGTSEKWEEHTLSELLPLTFTKNDLNK